MLVPGTGTESINSTFTSKLPGWLRIKELARLTRIPYPFTTLIHLFLDLDTIHCLSNCLLWHTTFCLVSYKSAISCGFAFSNQTENNILCIYSRKMNSIQILSSDFICSLKQSRHIPVTWKISIYRCETTFFHLLTNLELFQKMNCCLLYDGYRYKPRGMGMYGVKRTANNGQHLYS